MPYPNEHSARIRNPGDFKEKPDWSPKGKFRRTAGGTAVLPGAGQIKVPTSIGVLWGQLKSQSGKAAAVQSLRFPIKTWGESSDKAKAWLKKNKVKYLGFEKAEPKKQQQEEAPPDELRETRETAPAAACRLAGISLQLGDNGEGAKTAPLKMLARTGEPINHWYWGRMVHDLAGMHRHKDRLPVDYIHNPKDVIGYLNHFSIEDNNLVCSGAVTPYGDNDRASEIVYKARAGVPYEASIDFGGDGIRIQRLTKDETAEVNGYELEGPATIFREWPLRGVAVCPYGADMHTISQLAGERKQVPITVLSQGGHVMFDAADEPVEVDEAVDTEAAEADQAVDAEGGEGGDAPAEEASELEAQIRAEVKRFVETFGDTGGRWFADGKTFEEAQQLYIAAVQKENAELKGENAELQERLEAARQASGLPEGVSAEPEPDEGDAELSTIARQLVGHINPATGKEYTQAEAEADAVKLLEEREKQRQK